MNVELTGYDVHIVCPGVRVDNIRAFVDRIAEQWPDLLISTSADRDSDYVPWHSGNVRLGDPEGELYLVRDDDMRQLQEESGYTRTADGASPVALYYNRAPAELDIRIVEKTPTGPEGQYDVDTYPATLVGDDLFLVTLVTAENPADDDFARRILDILKESLTGKL